MSFNFLDPRIQEILHGLGLSPTPGQVKYLKAILSKQDLLVVASTGSGKTFGTIIACLDRIVKEKPEPISTIVITPLKALNRDIFRRVLPELGQKLNISIAVRHGDTPSSERQKQTKNPPQILITTPELFQAMLPAKILGRIILKNVRIVVIDEIHELISTKRGVQLSLALERLKARTKKDFQRIGLSATIGNPSKVMKFLAPNSTNYQIVNIPSSKELDLKVVYPKDIPPYFKSLIKKLHTTDEAASRFFCLLDIIKSEPGTVLVFTNTRQQAEVLGYRLNRYNENVDPNYRINFEVHHSSLSTQSRLKAEQEVRRGKLDVIIATSSLELGIDVGSINLVVQYMSPRRIETLIQRVGRAGHGLDRVSRGIIIAENPRDLMESFFIKKLSLEGRVEPTKIHNLAWDVLFHQIIGILIDLGETSVKKILRIINSTFLYQNVTARDLLPLLEYGRKNYFFYINKDENSGVISLKIKRKAYRYYYSNLSTIPIKKTYTIIDIGTQSRVGHLDDAFVTTRGEKGTIFILNGLPWKLLAIKEDRIEVRQVKGITQAALPTWEGELIPVSYMLSQCTLELYNQNISFDSENLDVQKELIEFRDKQLKLGEKPSKSKLLIEQAGRQFVIHTFLGSKGNETFGLLLSSIIGAKQGHSIQYKADAYSVFFSCFRPDNITDILTSLEKDHIIPLLEHRIKNSELFSWSLRQVAKRFGAISEHAESSPMMTKLITARYQDTIIGNETVNEILDEKMDLYPVLDLFERLEKGLVDIEVIPVKTFESPLSLASTQPISMNVLKLRPSSMILEKIENRINNTWIRLVCMRLDCSWEKTQRVSTLPDIIECPKCRSRFIAVVHQNNNKTKKLLKKSISKKTTLTDIEMKELKSAKKAADIILSFGKRAAFVLAGRGIGPSTAIRILRENHKTKEDLLASIYKHEATFSRTREYWN